MIIKYFLIENRINKYFSIYYFNDDYYIGVYDIILN